MAGTLVNQGEEVFLKAFVNHTAGQNLVLCLYTAATIADTLVEGSVTEATGGGYSSITLTGSSWSYTGGNPGSIAYAQQTFTFSGSAGTILGYYLKQVTSGKLMAIEAFSSSQATGNGFEIKVTPTITVKDVGE